MQLTHWTKQGLKMFWQTYHLATFSMSESFSLTYLLNAVSSAGRNGSLTPFSRSLSLKHSENGKKIKTDNYFVLWLLPTMNYNELV